MPQLTAREITAYACKADKSRLPAGPISTLRMRPWITPVCCATAVWTHEPLAYIIGEWDFYGLTFKGGPFGAHSALGHRAAVASWSLSRPKSGFRLVFSICAAARAASAIAAAH